MDLACLDIRFGNEEIVHLSGRTSFTDPEVCMAIIVLAEHLRDSSGFDPAPQTLRSEEPFKAAPDCESGVERMVAFV